MLANSGMTKQQRQPLAAQTIAKPVPAAAAGQWGCCRSG